MERFKELMNKKSVHILIIIMIIIFAFLIAGIVMLKYYVEGEKNPPFILSKMIIISSAEGIDLQDPNYKWCFNVNQNNDIYLTINKNPNYQNSEVIKVVRIENIQIDKKQSTGTIQLYKPAEEGLYKKEEQYVIKDNIEYKGSKTANINNLEIANQGGNILFRSSNQNIIQYKSNDEEIKHDGTLLAKTNMSKEQIQFSISFDILIETGKGIQYKGNIELELPVGDILTQGTATYEKVDFSDVIFKRM